MRDAGTSSNQVSIESKNNGKEDKRYLRLGEEYNWGERIEQLKRIVCWEKQLSKEREAKKAIEMLTQEREHLSARATKKLEKTVEKRTSTANLPEQKTEAR